jgi:hypothetical protein
MVVGSVVHACQPRHSSAAHEDMGRSTAGRSKKREAIPKNVSLLFLLAHPFALLLNRPLPPCFSVKLDDSGRIHTMRTMSLNPPIFGKSCFCEVAHYARLTLSLVVSPLPRVPPALSGLYSSHPAHMKRLSPRPTEIENFLEDEECETIMK